jgi:hypothetical protein
MMWAGITTGLIFVNSLIQPAAAAGDDSLRYFPLVPFALSVLVRWLLLPRFRNRQKAFPVFIAGLALAEGTGLIGLLLVPSFRQSYFYISLFAFVQYAPIFVGKYED